MTTIYTRGAALALAIALVALRAKGQNPVASSVYVSGPNLTTVVPGEVLTLTTTALNVPDATAAQVPLPTKLSGVSVTVRVIGATDSTGYPTLLPILRVYSINAVETPTGTSCAGVALDIFCTATNIVVEIPTEDVCAPASNRPPETCTGPPYTLDLPPLLILNVVANGVTGPDLPLQVTSFFERALSSCDSVFGPQTSCYPLVTHANGSLVTDSSPAKVGETITLYATGLGVRTAGNPPTGSVLTVPMALAGADPTSAYYMVFGYQYPIPPGSYLPGDLGPANVATSQTFVHPAWVGMVPGYVGLGQVNVTVPPAPSGVYPSCQYVPNATLGFNNAYSGTVSLCVQQ